MKVHMHLEQQRLYTYITRTLFIYICLLLGIAVLLGVLHYFYADIRVEGIKWFNLDKERNLPTWFSGGLFFLFGCAAFFAYYWEKKINALSNESLFRLPFLWLGVGLAGLLMSLDEITILHENILWRQTRLATATFGEAWVYITQWQILFAPVIVVLFSFLLVFFYNRFSISQKSRNIAFVGIGYWIGALFLEGIRGTIKQVGKWQYNLVVLAEEEMEMIGTILLFAAVITYVIDIALDLTEKRRLHISSASRFLNKRSLALLCITLMLFSMGSAVVYYFAHKQAQIGAPLPGLYKKAKRESIPVKKHDYKKAVSVNNSAFKYEEVK